MGAAKVLLAWHCGTGPSILFGLFILDDVTMNEKARLTQNEMDIIAKAISSPLIEGTFALAAIGRIRKDDMGGVQNAADLMLRQEGIETTLVTGIVESENLYGVLHTISSTVEPEKWIRDLFPEEQGLVITSILDSKEVISFEIPLGPLGRCKDKDALWDLTRNFLSALFLEKIGRNEKVS